MNFKEGDVDHLTCFQNYTLDINKFGEVLNELTNKSTYFYQGNGPEYTLKIGRLSHDMDKKQIVKNIRTATKFLLKHLLSQGLKIKFIRRISLKLGQSESFPIYSYLTPKEKQYMRKALK